MAAGGELIIDDKLVRAIHDMEKALQGVAKEADATQRKTMAWLSSLSSGNIDAFTNKIKQLESNYMNLANALSNSKGFENLSEKALNTAGAITQLITVMGQNTPKKTDGFDSIRQTLDSLLAQLAKARQDIDLYYQAIGTGKKEYIEFGQTGLKEAEARAESLMRKIEALNTTYQQLKQSSFNITDLTKGTMDDERNRIELSGIKMRLQEEERVHKAVMEHNLEELKAINDKIEAGIQGEKAFAKAEEERHRKRQEYYNNVGRQWDIDDKAIRDANMAELKAISDKVENAKRAEKEAVESAKREHDAKQKYYEDFGKIIEEEEKRKKQANTDYYNWEMEQLAKEVKAAQDAANKKLQAEQEYAAKRKELQAMYTSLWNRNEADMMSARVAQRTNGQTWNVDANEVIRRTQEELAQRRQYIAERTAMYERMFEEIERKEKKVQDDIRNYEQQKQNESLAKYKQQKEEQARVDKYYHDKRQREYDEMFKAIERNENRQRAINAKYGDSSKGALNYSNRLYSTNGVRSIQNMETALNKLRDAQRRLNVGTEEGRKRYAELGAQIKKIEGDLNRVTNASERMKKSHSGLINTGQQLARQLALVFSVSQVQGYINKIVQVRREFELQQKALGAILRDQDKGNELWNQTIQLAVKSPFRVKELITYTKQLAAYRIETEKLHDTTRMLADVSAGLGVDMNRLILAYGQVRAAEYLRGTELRQFTEAGIPLLAELAEHFSALEGRAVSTADVFEMISKRMVTFADVSQVFQKMTSEGGVFFQMQEKQSETLHGLINNLYDSVDLMMNAIGKENEGTIVGFLKSVKSLAESWREVAVRIKDVGTALLIAKSAQWVFTTSFNRGMAMNKMSLLGLNLGIKESTISFNKWIATLSIAELKTLGFSTKTALLQKAFAGIKVAAMGAANAIASFLPVAIIYGLYELYMALTKASREAERLRKELSDTVSVDVADLDKAIGRYENLANRLGMVNKGSMAHKEIISALNKEYGEYLDFLVNEETTVAQLNAAYDNLVETMRQKQSMEAFQKGMDTIAEHYRTQITEANKTFKDEFGKIGQLELKTTDNNQYLIPTSEEVEHIFNLINQKVRETKDVTSIDDLTEQRDLLNSVIEEFYGKDITLLGADYDNLKFIELMVNRRKEELQLQKEIDAQFRKSLKTREANLALTALQNKYEEDKLKIVNKTTSEFEKQEELSKLKDKFELDVIDLKLRFNIIGDQEALEEKDKIINWAEGTIGDINEAIKSELGSTFSGEELSKVLFTRELKETKTIANYLKDLKTSWESQNKVIAEQISLKSELGELDENNEKILQDALRKEELYRRTLKLLGVEIQYTERLSEGTRIAINSLEGLPEEMQISLEQAYGGIDNILSGLKKKETEHLNVIRQLNELKANGLPYDEQRLKMAEQTYWWTKKLQDLIDPDSKTAIAEDKVDYINSKLEEKYQIDSIGRTKDEVTLLSEANTEKEAAIAYEKQLNAQKAMGLAITQEQLDNAKKETKQTTLKWKLLGGTKEEGSGGRTNSLYDERIKVIDDMNKKYRELNRTLDKTNSLQGAFDAYKDAFAEAFAGIKWIPKNVQSMTPQEFASQVLNFPSEDDLVKFLDRLAEEPMKTFEKIKVELAKGKYVYDMKVRAKVEDDEKLIQSIEDMFGTYELSLELKDMNIPTDIAEKLFGFESLDLKGLKEKLKELEPQFIGTDQEKKYRDYLQKVEEMEDKALKDRIKKFYKFLQDTTDAIQVAQQEGALDIQFATELFNSGKLTVEQYNQAVRKIIADTNKEISKLNLDKFKDSPEYIAAMGDMAGYTAMELTKLQNAIKNIIAKSSSTMQPEEIKAYNDALDKINDQLDRLKSPFAKTAISEIKEINRLNKELDAEKEKQQKLEQRRNDLEIQERELTSKLTNQKYHGAPQEEIDETISKIQETQEGIADINGDLNTTAGNIANIGNKLQKLYGGSSEGWAKANKALTETFRAIDGAVQIFNEVKDLAASFGADVDTGAWSDLSIIFSGIGEMSQKFQSGWQSFLSDDIVGGVAGLVGGIFSVIKLFNQLFDNQLEKQIKQQEHQVKLMGKAYEKLEKQMEGAYSTDSIKQNTDEMLKNLEEQAAANEKMAELEQAKKDTDKEKVEQYLEERDKALEEREKLLIEREKAFGGFGGQEDYKSASEEFVDAWLSAFKETGSGLKGLQEKFDEFFLDMIKKQLLNNVMEKSMTAFYDDWNTALADGRMDAQDAESLKQAWKTLQGELDSKLQAMTEVMGVADDIRGTAELGTLQKGIQGVTEDTAEIIASYLNAIRFMLGEQSSNIKSIADNYGNIEAPNTMLGQLKMIADNTRAIHDLLGSVTKAGHREGGYGIKVFTD